MKNKDKKNLELGTISEPKDTIIAPLVPFIREEKITIYEDVSTLDFTRARITKDHIDDMDKSGNLRIDLPEGELIAIISEYEHLTTLYPNIVKLNPFAQKILTAANSIHFKRHGNSTTLKKNEEIYISMNECLELFGKAPTKNNRKNFARKLFAAGITLPSIGIIATENPRNPNSCRALRYNIFTYGEGGAHGIKLKYTEEYAEYLTKSYFVELPEWYFRIDERNPTALSLTRKLNHYFKLNLNKTAKSKKKKAADLRNFRVVLSVSNALRYCPEIPDKETVLASDRHITKRIVEPFENTLDYLKTLSKGSFKWQYCNSKGVPLSINQLNGDEIIQEQLLGRQNITEDFFSRYILYEM